MSENRSLAVLEILVHLSASIPDRYLLGMAEVPDDLVVEVVNEDSLPQSWSTLDPREQVATRRIGDGWVVQQRSAVLSVPSVISGERNYVLNPAHPDFQRIAFAATIPFRFDARLLSTTEQGPTGEATGLEKRS
jgi:RES domain-containing protein